MNSETHHPLLSMEANSNALFEFLIAGLGKHLTAASEYGICWVSEENYQSPLANM